MKGREKPRRDKYKEIVNGGSCRVYVTSGLELGKILWALPYA
jgi:hypothetical protein